MLETDIAWAAGFFDGEGTVGITNTTKGQLYLRVEACNTDVRPLHRLIALFGGALAVHNKGNERHAASFKWRLHGDKAAKALSLMKPYMSVKSAQAEIGLEFQATMRADGRPKPENIHVLREFYRLRMADLNTRGPQWLGTVRAR